MSKEEFKEPLDSDPLIALLKRDGLPQPSPWFSARTLARLRHERTGLFSGWSFSWVRAAFFLAMIAFIMGGWHLKTERENQKLTFSALEAVAQGEETPFAGEDPTWADNLF